MIVNNAMKFSDENLQTEPDVHRYKVQRTHTEGNGDFLGSHGNSSVKTKKSSFTNMKKFLKHGSAANIHNYGGYTVAEDLKLATRKKDTSRSKKSQNNTNIRKEEPFLRIESNRDIMFISNEAEPVPVGGVKDSSARKIHNISNLKKSYSSPKFKSTYAANPNNYGS